MFFSGCPIPLLFLWVHFIDFCTEIVLLTF
jgi:hypothetical protein